MNFKNLIKLLFIVFFLHSCANYESYKNTEKINKKYFLSKGFALIYKNDLYEKKILNRKINNDELRVIHSSLKANTYVKIINPLNSKFFETKIYKKGIYPSIFNVVISEKVASLLNLDPNNPYVELIEIKKNKTFIAKKSNTFDEEKNVAGKAPVEDIKMDDLSNNNVVDLNKDKKTLFLLVISDFYYETSAYNLMDELIKKTKMNNFSVKKINDKKYRLFVGPFKNFNALKTSYISLNKLGFENLDVYSE